MLDLFPYIVTVGDTTYRNCRVMEVGGRLLVFTHEEPDGLRLVETAGLAGPVERRRIVKSFATDRGTWAAGPDAGCGCRHPLKRVSRAALLAAAGLDA